MMNRSKTVFPGALLTLMISILWIAPAYAGESHNTLTLPQCIEKALENNPLIGYENGRVQEEDARRRQAASQRWPRLSAVGGYTHFTDTQRLAPPRRLSYPLIFTDDLLSWDLVLSMPLFTGGRIRNEIEAGEMRLQSAEYSRDHARQALIFQVTGVYFSILKQQKVIEFLQYSQTTLEEHLRRVKELIAAKKAAKLDALRIEVRLADTAQKIEKEKNTLAIQIRSLANLMGSEGTDFHIPPLTELPFAELDMDIEKNLDRAYAHRADYRSAQKDVEAQERRLKAVLAGYWPSVSLHASYGAKKAVGSYALPPEIDGYEDIGQLGLSIDLPLFDGGKVRANVRQEKAKLALLKEKLREVKLDIRLDVETAVYNIISTGKRITATEKAIEQANESLRIEMEKYDLGKGSITDIFDAESALREVKTVYYMAIADYSIYLSQLKFVQGESE